MLAFTTVFGHLVLGELAVHATGLPVPGPIVGLLSLMVAFALAGGVDPQIARIFDGVAPHFAVLFVPAGAGVVASWTALSDGALVIFLSVVGGTLATILTVAALASAVLGRGADAGRQDGGEEERA